MSCPSWLRCVPSLCPEINLESVKTSTPYGEFRCVPFRCVPIEQNTGAHRRGRERAPRLPAVPRVTGHTRTHRGTPERFNIGLGAVHA
jgi:hypothetical protein